MALVRFGGDDVGSVAQLLGAEAGHLTASLAGEYGQRLAAKLMACLPKLKWESQPASVRDVSLLPSERQNSPGRKSSAPGLRHRCQVQSGGMS